MKVLIALEKMPTALIVVTKRMLLGLFSSMML